MIRCRDIFIPSIVLVVTPAPSRYDLVLHMVQSESLPTEETGMVNQPQLLHALVRGKVVCVLVLDLDRDPIPHQIRWSDERIAVFLNVVLPVEVVLPAEGLEGFEHGMVVSARQRSPIEIVQAAVGFAPRRSGVRSVVISYAMFFVDFVAVAYSNNFKYGCNPLVAKVEAMD